MTIQFWSLLCRDEGKDNHTKRYPCWYANILARSLMKYGHRLHLLTDQEISPHPNIEPHRIAPAMYAELKFKPLGWWNKLLFYNRRFFPREILFVDLDSVFINDPAPLFEYLDGQGVPLIHERAVFSWNLPRPTIASPLFYLNHGRGEPGLIWEVFKSESALPKINGEKYLPVRMRGDQDFIEYAVSKTWPDLQERYLNCSHWPFHFYGRYKVLMKYPAWGNQTHHYKGLSMDQFISVGFNGRPKLEDIVRYRLDGYSSFMPFISNVELQMSGFTDPNAKE